MIKVTAIIGFIILAIVIDCGGVPSDTRGYIGAHYWHQPGAFHDGFRGFCSVFVNAAFAFAGTELCGLAAAEAADPRKSLPKASKQVFWRIAGFYVLSLFMVGLIVPSDSPDLLGASTSNTKASPFVLAIEMAGIKGLPSVMNVVITISVISVANSCTFGSTRTMQAMAADGMGPRFLAYVDNKGRPVWCVVVQLVFGLLAFVQEASVGSQVFSWLLALTGLSYFFIWGSICLCHIRFRAGWKAQGHSLDELPFKAAFGVVGSYIGLTLNILAIIATFYTSLWVRQHLLERFCYCFSRSHYSTPLVPEEKKFILTVPVFQPPGASPDPKYFFQQYLAAPVIIALYIFWKVFSRGKGGMYRRAVDMDLKTGMREIDLDPSEDPEISTQHQSLPKRILRIIF